MLRMRRVLAMILSIILCIGLLPGESYVKAGTGMLDEEVQSAINQGLVPAYLQTDYEGTITYEEYCVMLRRVINRKNPKILPNWDNIARLAISSKKEMKREDAMMAIYEAACILGCGKRANGMWGPMNKDIDSGINGWKLSNQYPEWPNYNKTAPFERYTGDIPSLSYYVAAYSYAQDQYSLVSLKPVFDYDKENKDLHMLEALSVKDAIITILRFYESLVADAPAETVAEINGQATAKRAEIKVTTTNIIKSDTSIPGSTYTGTAYYVSSSTGNDDNDGLTPETAFKTLNRVHGKAYDTNTPLLAGDAVFFKRGDIWRNEPYICKEGVTYSAYGEGVKPRFYGSPESGVGAGKWTLHWEGTNGEKVWKFYKNLTDVGGIVFNDGTSYANREYGWWAGDESGYVQFDNPSQSFSETTSLDDDLDFCSMIDYTGYEYPINRYLLNKSGPVYLRCDSGNPGTLYSEIEFETTDALNDWKPLFRCKTGCVLDNLCMLYWGDTGIAGDNIASEHIYIQNCEVGWGGNCIMCYKSAEPTIGQMIAGDGIYGICNNSYITNNYCHNIDGNAIRVENPNANGVVAADQYGTATITGNYIENSGQGITFEDWDSEMVFSSIDIENNLVMNMGSGYCHGCFCPYLSIGVSQLSTCTKNIVIKNNTAYGSKDLLFDYSPAGTVISEGNHFYYREKPSCTHDYKEKTVPATCTANGSHSYVCSLCGDEKDYEILPATGYAWEAFLYDDAEYKNEKEKLGQFGSVEDLNTALTGKTGYLALTLKKNLTLTELPGNATLSGVMISGDSQYSLTLEGTSFSLPTDIQLSVDTTFSGENVQLSGDPAVTLRNMTLNGNQLTMTGMNLYCGDTVVLNTAINGLNKLYIGKNTSITPNGDSYDWINEFDANVILNKSLTTSETFMYGTNLHISQTGELKTKKLSGIYGNILLQKNNGVLGKLSVTNTMKDLLWQVRIYAYESLIENLKSNGIHYSKAKAVCGINKGTILAYIPDTADQSCYDKLGFMPTWTDTDADWNVYWMKQHAGAKLLYQCVHANTQVRNARKATCTTPGYTGDTYCLDCGDKIKPGTAIKALGHSPKTILVKATTSKNGSNTVICSRCRAKLKQTIIYYAKTASLSTTSYVYDGKVKKPAVTVRDAKGNRISASYYTLSYSGNKYVGQGSVTITFRGIYVGKMVKTFTIHPNTTSISKLKPASKRFTVTWKKQSSQTSGYVIQYSTSSKFSAKDTKSVTITKNTTTSKTIKSLKAKKKYYIRIHTYKMVKINGKSTKVYSSWSKTGTVTTKK